jgi:hypothetical protein
LQVLDAAIGTIGRIEPVFSVVQMAGVEDLMGFFTLRQPSVLAVEYY